MPYPTNLRRHKIQILIGEENQTSFHSSNSETEQAKYKRMRNIFSKSPSPSRFTPPPSPSRHTFSESLMEENIEIAESIISTWDPSNNLSTNYCSLDSLFSHENRQAAKHYLNSVKDLQMAMRSLALNNSANEKLVRAQNLMQTAMKRLEKEFYQILKSNRDYLDPESVSTHSSIPSTVSDFDEEWEDESSRHESDESISGVERASMLAMADLKAIADCMIASGYAKECVKVYNIIRKSIVDEALYHLGVERLTASQILNMDWEVLEVKIKNWIHAAKVAVRTLFYGERILCDQVFSTSAAIRESCFSEISKEGALALFSFPENVAKCKKAPEKMFRTLDLYETLSDIWPEIESIFSFESTAILRSTAVNALLKLGEAVRTILTDFESAIQKEASRSAVPGAGVHPLTRYVMNYVSFLGDYSGILSDIVADWPLRVPSPLPESYLGSPDTNNNITSPIAVRLAWLILVLLCKLDSKAQLYKDVAQSYLFLANNLQYIVVKFRNSNLNFLLGEDWAARHDAKVKQYAANYERMGWSKVMTSLPENPTAEIPLDRVKDHFRRFNAAFEEAYTKQLSWVVPDPRLRDEIKISLARKFCASYKEFYEKYGMKLKKQMWVESLVRFTPDDLGNYLSDLFHGDGGAASESSHSSQGGRGR